MKTLGNAKEVSEGLGMLSIKEMVSNINIEDEMCFLWKSQMNNVIENPIVLIFKDNHNIIMASNESGLIAYSHPFFCKDYCYIRNIYINPNYRKKGLGSKIIKDLIEYFSKEYNVSSFEVEADNNSILFWGKLGFKLIDNKSNNRMRYE